MRVYNEQTRQVGSEAWALSRCRILSVSEIGLNWNSVAVLENFTGFHSVSLNLWRIFTCRKSIFAKIREKKGWWAVSRVSREVRLKGKTKLFLSVRYNDCSQHNDFFSLEFLYILKYISLLSRHFLTNDLYFLWPILRFPFTIQSTNSFDTSVCWRDFLELSSHDLIYLSSIKIGKVSVCWQCYVFKFVHKVTQYLSQTNLKVAFSIVILLHA